ncbi:MAG: hypothetical protein MRY83_21365 [Flavobacteriales bacterium]|nr:hypothetical protein [Flavobacteriales bacterium]
METNARNNISNFVASIPAKFKVELGKIRDWEGVSIGQHKDLIWLKGLSEEQMEHQLLVTIPGVERFTLSQNKLFPLGSLLPSQILPSVLWTPIERAFQLSLPKFNHNFFGNYGDLEIKIVPSIEEQDPMALICEIQNFEKYIYKAPEIRLSNLKWCLLNNESVFILGHPIVPIPGRTYWLSNDHLIPVGFQFNYQSLEDEIQKKLNPNNQDFLLWTENSRFIEISKEKLEQLSISSYRQTWYDLLKRQKVK